MCSPSSYYGTPPALTWIAAGKGNRFLNQKIPLTADMLPLTAHTIQERDARRLPCLHTAPSLPPHPPLSPKARCWQVRFFTRTKRRARHRAAHVSRINHLIENTSPSIPQDLETKWPLSMQQRSTYGDIPTALEFHDIQLGSQLLWCKQKAHND
jgi:hypothetical protein